MKKLDFSFGEPTILNDNLKKYVTPTFDWKYTNYGPRSLNESTKDIVLEMVHKITGKKYKNLILTNGAQDGINLLLIKYEYDYLHTEDSLDKPHYSFHRKIALRHNSSVGLYEGVGDIILNVIPNNPTGSMDKLNFQDNMLNTNPIVEIWDAAYFSSNYIGGNIKKFVPKTDYMVGSFGKTFGISGLRLGWIASDHDLSEVEELQRIQQLRPNNVSIGIMLQILHKMSQDNWDTMESFFKNNYNDIQENKELFQSIIDKYHLQPMPENGMFYWGGNAELKADLDRLGVLYVKGTECGGKEDQLRLNMAVNKEIMKELVTLLLKL